MHRANDCFADYANTLPIQVYLSFQCTGPCPLANGLHLISDIPTVMERSNAIFALLFFATMMVIIELIVLVRSLLVSL